MDISRLSKMRIGVLTEAPKNDAPNPEELVDNFMTEESEKGSIQEDNQQPPTDNSNQQQEQPQNDQQQTQENNQPQQNDDNEYSLDNQDGGDSMNAPTDQAGADMNTNDAGGQSLGEDIPDDYNAKDDMPKLKILQSISDKEYKLNNIHCHEQFKDLYNNVDNFINNYIMNIVTKTEKQCQVVNYVHNNLSKMLDDLNTYICYKFSDIYEDNILAYTTFLKRYHIATKIIKYISDENNK